MNAPSSHKQKRIDYLEILRFVLACLTMLWHYYYFGPKVGEVSAPVADFFPLRYFSFSVEVFFIISGFIVTASAINRRPLDFLIGRIVRLGPCLLVCATISMAAGLAFGHWPTLRSYFASILIFPLAFTNGADWSYWSLRLEIVFYALIFFCAWFINIERNIFRIALLLVAGDIVSIVSLHGFGLDVFGSANAQYPIDRYMSFFAIGMLLYVMFSQGRRGVGIMVVLVAAIAAASFHCYEEANRIAELTKAASVNAWVGAGIALTGIAAFIAFMRSTTNQRVAAFFAVLGKTSYPLYLLHQNVGYLLIRYIDTRLDPGIECRPLVMIGMIALSAGIALFLEPMLATYYKRALSALASAGGKSWPRLFGSKRRYGDAE